MLIFSFKLFHDSSLNLSLLIEFFDNLKKIASLNCPGLTTLANQLPKFPIRKNNKSVKNDNLKIRARVKCFFSKWGLYKFPAYKCYKQRA